MEEYTTRWHVSELPVVIYLLYNYPWLSTGDFSREFAPSSPSSTSVAFISRRRDHCTLLAFGQEREKYIYARLKISSY